MAKTRQKRESALVGTDREDYLRLRQKWEEFSAKDPSRTQDWLATKCGWTTQGAATQYLNGYIKLNLSALLRFARVMGFSPAEVSPTLAAELEPFLVTVSDHALSKPAREAAALVEAKPEKLRQPYVDALKALDRMQSAGTVASDGTVEARMPVTAGSGSPKALRLMREALVKSIRGPSQEGGLFDEKETGK